MDNICVLADFFVDLRKENYYTEIRLSCVPDKYSIHVGGANFIFISNDRNRTIRFNPRDTDIENISDNDFTEWMKRIHRLYPGF